jgi:hypothetical protein
VGECEVVIWGLGVWGSEECFTRSCKIEVGVVLMRSDLIVIVGAEYLIAVRYLL